MSNPIYQTVRGYKTVALRQHGLIVSAVKSDAEDCLTGLVVDVEPEMWPYIDGLEFGYRRVRVITTSDIDAWMYAN